MGPVNAEIPSQAAEEIRPLHWAFLGSMPYGRALELQERLSTALKRGEGAEHLLLLEHPHVFTLGRNASSADVTAAPGWLESRGIELFQTDRGGQVTYHGPGQLVGYPILNLSPDRRDIRRYVRDLLEVLIATLAEFGVTAEKGEGPEHIGLWVDGAKIASVGVHLSRWVTTHGFALNVATDLDLFAGIVACGLRDVRMTSVEKLTGQRPALGELAAVYARRFADHFGRRLAPAARAVSFESEH